MKSPPLNRRISYRLLLVFVTCVLSVVQDFAQDFGGFKPGIKWQQINTPTIRVIFPKGLETQANRVANEIVYIDQHNRTSIGPLKKKLDLILNNQGVISNGYVTLMPYHSEFFTTPMQDGFSLGTNPWLDLLSVHEYRHALQYINMRQGYAKWLWLLTGESGWGTLINITTPGWFFEGDAVATETALTNQGRGRMPSFLQQYKSILLNDKRYTYMKARNGSYRDMVPDAYELGYLLCSFGRENYGNDLWPKVIHQTSTLKGIIYPFSDAVKAFTGLNTRQFYKKAMADYKETWTSESAKVNPTLFTPISDSSNTITEYRFPVYVSNGDIIVYKESYKETGAIVRITPDGKEKKICTMGISQDPYFSVSGKKTAWCEVTWDPRYSSKSYSDVVLYDEGTGKKTYLTKKQRYFSPAISPDVSKIAVVEVDSLNICRIKILDSQSGAVISTLPNPDRLYYTYPKWDIDGNSLISSARTDKGSMLIIKQAISGGAVSKLSGEYNQIIGEVLVTRESLYFTAGFSGINNIYSLSKTDGTLRQLTGSKFGAYYPAMSPDAKRLVYSDFNIKGYRLVSASTDSLLSKIIHPAKTDFNKSFEFSYFQTEGGNILDKIPDQKFKSTAYLQRQHPLRIHSWELSPGFFSAGINIISDNILNNLHAEGGFEYYYNERAPGFNAMIQYGGIYPVISAGASRYYRHPGILDVIEGVESAQALSVENQYSLTVKLPYDFSKGMDFRSAAVLFGYDYITSRDFPTGNNPSSNVSVLSVLSGQAQVSSIRKSARQNIATSLGMNLELTANKSISLTEAIEYQAIGDFAIRGFAPNHNFILSAAWKYEPYSLSFHFMDLFLYPRGYSIPAYDWMFTVQSAYHFPLFYPDFGFSGIFYCSRVRGSIFADYGYASIPGMINTTSNGIFLSTGSELIFDTRWFNLADLPLGVRFSLLLTPDFLDPARRMRVEVVIPVLRL
ncbi:MAG: hypothetical protein WC699_15155 [Bacteroidales bacterium]|jgi:hypothetical protein